MAKKKKSQQASGDNGTPMPESTPAASKKAKSPEPSTSALIICRNKHWRYISSFHGPWLQLPPEVLESLAHSNYMSPRPRQIDPAVFYDLVKIRKAVDEATNLAVRATSGLTSSALSNSLNAGNGMYGGASAAALGLGYGGAGGTAKLSRERKHRMRELATQKLSTAYRLDEIAASVATMQSASTLEDVAQFVLQRDANDLNARYVHFFHEKIPSRMMAQCTPLEPLNEIVSESPNDGSPLRTRALTRLFKEDYLGAARDLTAALSVSRYMQQQHRAGKDQLVLASTAKEDAEKARDWRQDYRVEEEDQPSSLEVQLLFHRAGTYFTIACQHVNAALDGLKEYEEAQEKARAAMDGRTESEPPPLSPELREAHRKRLEARKIVKTNAKRALRDYVAFLSHFEYTPGVPSEIAEEVLRRVTEATNGFTSFKRPKGAERQRLTDANSPTSGQNPNSTALVPHRTNGNQNGDSHRTSWAGLPAPVLYPLSSLFSSTPPASLPPYPPETSSALSIPSSQSTRSPSPASMPSSAATAFAESQEAMTYHPLLTDALHTLLLAHCLVQTSPTELRRHAHNTARLARVADGYPIFLAARSPARADWIEVLRRTKNFIGLDQSWEVLCRPAPLPSSNGAHDSTDGQLAKRGGSAANGAGAAAQKETEQQKRERRKHSAILEALADERVVDEESFQQAVRAREIRAVRDEEGAEVAEQMLAASEADDAKKVDAGGDAASVTSSATLGPEAAADVPKKDAGKEKQAKPKPGNEEQPKRWAQGDEREYPISTERAEAISRWVLEAPVSVEGSKKARKGTKGKGKAGQSGLEEKARALNLEDQVEEEIDE